MGPSFTAANLSTKIVIYDHNLDRPNYPLTILKDVNASKFIDGSAFHMYAGNASVMGDIHKDYPSKKFILYRAMDSLNWTVLRGYDVAYQECNYWDNALLE